MLHRNTRTLVLRCRPNKLALMLQCSNKSSTPRKPAMKMNLDQFAAANKASLETLFGMSGQAFDSVEKLVALNLQTVKTVLAETQATAQTALSSKSPADLMKVQTAALQAAPQKAMAYGQQVQAIFAPMMAAQRATFDAKLAESQAKFLEGVSGALKDAPGADKFLALAKSAVTTVNSAYEGMDKASKQVTEVVTANVKKATGIAVKASKGELATA
jgi:phasin family protein